MTPEISTAFFRDCGQLAPDLRKEDVKELAAHGHAPKGGLIRAVGLSERAYSIRVGHKPIALFGFAPIAGQPNAACPWLLGSEALVTTHARWFARHTAEIVQKGDDRWVMFYNLVDARNKKHVRWLRWAGFQIDPPVAGPSGLPFHPFRRFTPQCVT